MCSPTQRSARSAKPLISVLEFNLVDAADLRNNGPNVLVHAMKRPWSDQVNRFCFQYLQAEATLDFPQPEYLRLEEVQDEIYGRLFAEDKAGFGPPDRYRIKKLKQLISHIESAIDDWDIYAVSDDLMSTASLLMSTPLLPETATAQTRCCVTYHLSLLDHVWQTGSADARHECPRITILENRSLIAAGGTTGHRTWEAGLHMGQFLSANPSIIRGKHILELGTGTGYLAILCAKYLRAAHVVASDGSDDVLSSLPDNLFLNGLQVSPNLKLLDMKWGHALVATEDEQWNGGRPVDVVLGADIIYDGRVIPALTSTLWELLQRHPKAQVYIAVTNRNAETYQTFLDDCKQRNLTVDNVRFEVPSHEQQTGPFYDDEAAILLHRVSKS